MTDVYLYLLIANCLVCLFLLMVHVLLFLLMFISTQPTEEMTLISHIVAQLNTNSCSLKFEGSKTVKHLVFVTSFYLMLK